MTDDDGKYTKIRNKGLRPDGDFGSEFFRTADPAMGDIVGLPSLGTTDVDLLKERNGVFLVGEIKRLGYDFGQRAFLGQRFVLERLSRLTYEGVHVVETFVAEATTGFETVNRFRVCREGVWGPWCTVDARMFLLQYFVLRAHDMKESLGRQPRKDSQW